jgi:hypothetical protein
MGTGPSLVDLPAGGTLVAGFLWPFSHFGASSPFLCEMIFGLDKAARKTH